MIFVVATINFQVTFPFLSNFIDNFDFSHMCTPYLVTTTCLCCPMPLGHQIPTSIDFPWGFQHHTPPSVDFYRFFTTIATHMSIFACVIGVSPPPGLPTHLLLTQVGIPSIHGWGAIKHLLFHLFHLGSVPYTVLCQLGVDIMSTHS